LLQVVETAQRSTVRDDFDLILRLFGTQGLGQFGTHHRKVAAARAYADPHCPRLFGNNRWFSAARNDHWSGTEQ